MENICLNCASFSKVLLEFKNSAGFTFTLKLAEQCMMNVMSINIYSLLGGLRLEGCVISYPPVFGESFKIFTAALSLLNFSKETRF